MRAENNRSLRQSPAGVHLGTRTNWRLEAAITGTLGSVPLHRDGRHPACQSARLPAAARSTTQKPVKFRAVIRQSGRLRAAIAEGFANRIS